MPLSQQQKDDINNAIKIPFENVTPSQHKDILGGLIEKGYFHTDFWLNDPVFMAKQELHTAPPNADEIYNAIDEAFFTSKAQKDRDSDSGFTREFIAEINPKNKEDEDYSDAAKQHHIAIRELITSVYQGEITSKKLETLLNEPEFNIDETYPPYGYTLLHYAVLGGQIKAVNLLLKEGMANPNIKAANGDTPLALVISNLAKGNSSSSSAKKSPKKNKVNKEIIESFLYFGANLNLVNQDLVSTLKTNFSNDEDVNLTEITRQSTTTLARESDSVSEELEKFFRTTNPESKILKIVRTSQNPEALLAERFQISGEFNLLEFAVKHRRFDLAKQCLACSFELNPDLIPSLLTFTLQQAFEARYTFKEDYFVFARYLLQKGVEATDEAREVIESFYPDIPEDLLTLTGLDTKFKGFMTKPCLDEVKQARKNISKETNLPFSVIKTKDGFALQNQLYFENDNVDFFTNTLNTHYQGPKRDLIHLDVKQLGGSWCKKTWTIQPDDIAQFASLRPEEKGPGMRTLNPPASGNQELSKEEKEAEKTLKKNAVKRELNLLRTKALAEKTYAELQKIMPNEWQLVPTQNGYELHYLTGFNHQKKVLDKKDPYDDICEWLRLNVNVSDLRIEKRMGTSSEAIVITTDAMQKFANISKNDNDKTEEPPISVIPRSNVHDEESPSTLMPVIPRSNVHDEESPSTLMPVIPRSVVCDEESPEPLSSLLRRIQLDPELNINSRHGKKKRTPLMQAVMEEDVDAAKVIMESNQPPNLDIEDADYRTVIGLVMDKIIIASIYSCSTEEVEDEKRQKIKQILLLLGQNKSSTWQHSADWNQINAFIPECKNEFDQFCMKRQKENANSDDDSSDGSEEAEDLITKMPSYSRYFKPQRAKYLFDRYRDNLLRLQELISYSRVKLSESDEQYVPNLLNALLVIVKEKPESFVPQVSCSGIPIFRQLPQDPHQCIVELMQKKSSSYGNYFQEMIDYYCHTDDQLKRALTNFQNDFNNIAGDLSSQKALLEMTAVKFNESSSTETSFVRKQIENWSHNLSKNLIPSEKLIALEYELLKQTLFTHLSATKINDSMDENLAQIIVATSDLIKALQKPSITDADVVKLVEECRDEVFCFSDRVWILFAHFVDALLSLVKKVPEGTPKDANFLFFKPFEKESLKEKSLEFLESFDGSKDKSNSVSLTLTLSQNEV